MQKVETFMFWATFGLLVGLVTGIVGSVGLGIISMEMHYPPRSIYYRDRYSTTNYSKYDPSKEYGYND